MEGRAPSRPSWTIAGGSICIIWQLRFALMAVRQIGTRRDLAGMSALSNFVSLHPYLNMHPGKMETVRSDSRVFALTSRQGFQELNHRHENQVSKIVSASRRKQQASRPFDVAQGRLCAPRTLERLPSGCARYFEVDALKTSCGERAGDGKLAGSPTEKPGC